MGEQTSGSSQSLTRSRPRSLRRATIWPAPSTSSPSGPGPRRSSGDRPHPPRPGSSRPPTRPRVTCGWSASARWRQARPCCWCWPSSTFAITVTATATVAVAESPTKGDERLPIRMLRERDIYAVAAPRVEADPTGLYL